jgi:hypothetical protein
MRHSLHSRLAGLWVLAALAILLAVVGPARAETEDGGKSAKRAGFTALKPSEKSQTQKTVEERGGVNPCNSDDPGFGVYEPWNRAPTHGQMLIPARGGIKDGKFDVVVHFHGHDPARKEFVRVMDGVVLVGITLGIGSGVYTESFAAPGSFQKLIESVEAEVAKKRGLESAHARKIAVASWSAGYGAVEQILRQKWGKEHVDAVILLDSLHAGYDPDGSLNDKQLEPFVEFAKRAKAGKRFMYMSHSSIIPPDYASTTETASYVVHKLGAKYKAAKKRKDRWGLELNHKFDAGNFHVRGFDGNDKMDHCAHIGLLKDVLKTHIKPRWKSPKGFGPKKKKGGADDDGAVAKDDKPKKKKKKKTAQR